MLGHQTDPWQIFISKDTFAALGELILTLKKQNGESAAPNTRRKYVYDFYSLFKYLKYRTDKLDALAIDRVFDVKEILVSWQGCARKAWKATSRSTKTLPREELLRMISEDTHSEAVRLINSHQAWSITDSLIVRDFLMLSLLVVNGARSSEVCNLSLNDFDNRIALEGGAACIYSRQHKTAHVFGAAALIASRDLNYGLAQYRNRRPGSQAGTAPLFVNRNRRKVDTDCLLHAVNKAWNGPGKVTTSNIRASIVTLGSRTNSDVEQRLLARRFCHSMAVQSRFYTGGITAIEAYQVYLNIMHNMNQ